MLPTNLCFLGDVMPGENVYHFGRSIRSIYGSDFKNFIPSNISDELFKKTDILLYNFEYSLVENTFDFNDISESVYCSTKGSLKIFPENIIKFVNIANNHFSEHGYKRAFQTITWLKENGFNVIGETPSSLKFINGDTNYYLWGVTLIPDKDKTNLYFKSSYDNLIKDINLPHTKNENDIWILSIHWGEEYISSPNTLQFNLAKKLSNLGFDIIHGHHPHVIQPYEYINNCLVMYSLGNFIFDQNFSDKTQKGLVVRLNIKKNDFSNVKTFIIKSKHYRPGKLIINNNTNISFKKNTYLSRTKKKITKWKYRILMKFEFLPHIFRNKMKVLKYIYKRKRI